MDASYLLNLLRFNPHLKLPYYLFLPQEKILCAKQQKKEFAPARLPRVPRATSPLPGYL